MGFLQVQNKGLLLKWAAHFGIEQDTLRRRVWCEKYGFPTKGILLHRLVGLIRQSSRLVFDIMQVWLESDISRAVFPGEW